MAIYGKRLTEPIKKNTISSCRSHFVQGGCRRLKRTKREGKKIT